MGAGRECRSCSAAACGEDHEAVTIPRLDRAATLELVEGCEETRLIGLQLDQVGLL